MPLSIDSRPEYREAWDCNPLFIPPDENVFTDIDLEDSTGDWQTIALDRFHDREINGTDARPYRNACIEKKGR